MTPEKPPAPPRAKRAFTVTLVAVTAGEALRLAVLTWLGQPWTIESVVLELALAAMAGALAGAGLARSSGRSALAAIALAALVALVDRALLAGFDLARGASIESLASAPRASAFAFEAIGLAALFASGHRESWRLRYPGFALFALSRLGPAWPDRPQLFGADLVGALETFTVLRLWLWPRAGERAHWALRLLGRTS